MDRKRDREDNAASVIDLEDGLSSYLLEARSTAARTAELYFIIWDFGSRGLEPEMFGVFVRCFRRVLPHCVSPPSDGKARKWICRKGSYQCVITFLCVLRDPGFQSTICRFLPKDVSQKICQQVLCTSPELERVTHLCDTFFGQLSRFWIPSLIDRPTIEGVTVGPVRSVMAHLIAASEEDEHQSVNNAALTQ